jgi:hypothetical protein
MFENLIASGKTLFGSPEQYDARAQLQRIINDRVLLKLKAFTGSKSDFETQFSEKTIPDVNQGTEVWIPYLQDAKKATLGMAVRGLGTPEEQIDQLAQWTAQNVIDKDYANALWAAIQKDNTAQGLSY